ARPGSSRRLPKPSSGSATTPPASGPSASARQEVRAERGLELVLRRRGRLRRPGRRMTVPVDGNAIAGARREALGGEMTTATGVCGTCRASAQVAELVVFASAAGSVARCPACGSVLIVAIVRHGETTVDTRGLASLDPPS